MTVSSRRRQSNGTVSFEQKPMNNEKILFPVKPYSIIMSDEENTSPPPCSLPHCEELANHDVCCSSTKTPHFLCDSCFCGYTLSQLDATGAFQGKRTLPNGSIVSERGELPCYLFLTNECNCACLPATTLERVLSTEPDATKAYESAKHRIAQAERNEEQAAQTTGDTEEDKQRDEDEESRLIHHSRNYMKPYSMLSVEAVT